MKDGSEFKFDTPINGNTVLTAKWKTGFEVGDTGPAGEIIFHVAEEAQKASAVSVTGTFARKYPEAAPKDITAGDGDTSAAIFCFGIYRVSNVNTQVVKSSDNSDLGFGRINT